MVDRYATNQFYNFDKYETIFGAGEAQSIGTTDNPPFIYPSKTLRNPINGTSTPIQRGYIRMMSEVIDDKYKTLSRRRLHFQFNPDSITRAVTARNDIQLWMNMDPSQMAQPIPGDANFAFELLFNREAEVTSGKYSRGGANLASTAVAANLPVESSTPIYQSAVTDIGVLADLIVFDELIGQGINSALLETMAERAVSGAAYTAAKEAQNATDDTADEEDKEPKPAGRKVTADDVENTLKANWGNSAFLVSQPIRVVFSSLFIVEGYVSSTTVTFNKFTPTMVPTQAVVGLQMQAMYMGFAKKDTFFTTSFAKNEAAVAEVVAESNAEEKALTAIGLDVFKKIGGSKAATGQFGITDDDYQVSLDGVYGQEDTDKCKIRFMASDALKKEIKDKANISAITVTAALTYIYKGNSGTPPVGMDVPINTTVYETKATVNLSVNEFKNDTPWSMGDFAFENKPIVASNPDMSNTSKYELRFAVFATLKGANGSTANSRQVFKLVKQVSWKEKVDIGDNASKHILDTPPS